jgi:hypothetical protein
MIGNNGGPGQAFMGTGEARVVVLASNKYRPRNAGASGTKTRFDRLLCVRSSLKILINCPDSFRFG